ncbi:MAG: MFS transporter, partial [Bacteroidales bacterium]
GLAAIFAGFGYGIMQPIIYDKATHTATGKKATLALSLVFATNYVAVSLTPFIMDGFGWLFQTKSNLFPFILNFVLLIGVLIGSFITRKSFAIRINDEYV